ncbi:L259 protein, partial [Acromyrmex charruanus]
LISAFFRLFNEGLEGEIKIDDRDISTMGLSEPSCKISIIPQEPVLFSESLRCNLDQFNHTDALIQDTIRSSFKECTVITIAHRLNTIIDSNGIIVMENGSIVEFGCPYELLHDKPNGYFSQMVEKTGNQMAQSLLEQAKKACEKNNDHCELNLSAQNTEYESDTTLTEQTAL